MAVPLPDASWTGNGGLVASPLSTVLVFASSSGNSSPPALFWMLLYVVLLPKAQVYACKAA
jgi:hypothetical protein